MERLCKCTTASQTIQQAQTAAHLAAALARPARLRRLRYQFLVISPPLIQAHSGIVLANREMATEDDARDREAPWRLSVAPVRGDRAWRPCVATARGDREWRPWVATVSGDR